MCSQKFRKTHTPVPVSFLIKLQAGCNFIKKETLAQVFSCKFCEISKNTFFIEHLWWMLLYFIRHPLKIKHRRILTGSFFHQNNIKPRYVNIHEQKAQRLILGEIFHEICVWCIRDRRQISLLMLSEFKHVSYLLFPPESCNESRS